MSVREPAKNQPKEFKFSSENLKKAKAIIAKYPDGRQASATMPLLDLAQRQNEGWVSIAAMNAIAEMLEIPYIKVYEVASFYTMYNIKPVGTNLVQVCRTTPCWLRGSEDILNTCKKKLGIDVGETTKDNKFTLVEVECLGACVNAPVVQINDDFFEDLTPQTTEKLLSDLSAGKKVKIGTQIKRTNSAPVGELTTLKEVPKSKGKSKKSA